MFTRQFTTSAGLTLSADVGGDSADPAVLLLHGGRENRHSWSRVARALVSAGRYVISLDLRGHGDSTWAPDGDYSLDAYVADVRDVIAQLPSAPTVVGFLLGGFIALALAGEHPEAVKALVLLNTTLEVDGSREAFGASVFSRTAEEGFETLDAAVEAVFAQPMFRNRIQSEAGVRRNLRQRDDGRWSWRHDPVALDGENPRRASLATTRARLEEAAAAVRAPTLFVHGGEASAVTPSQVRHMQAVLPHAEVSTLTPAEGAGADIGEAFDATLLGFLERVARRPDDRPAHGGVDPMTMRKAFGNFGTGVTVITTLSPDGRPVGLTANSFTSVSLSPPMLLFCLDHRSSSLASFDTCPAFAVNVLHIGQQAISDRFVSRDTDRFQGVGWETWDTGVPILQDAMASFECEREAAFDAGDHRIYVGRVRRVWFDPSRDPLLYLQGGYRRVHIA